MTAKENNEEGVRFDVYFRGTGQFKRNALESMKRRGRERRVHQDVRRKTPGKWQRKVMIVSFRIGTEGD